MGALYALSTFVTATTVEKAGRKTFLLIGKSFVLSVTAIWMSYLNMTFSGLGGMCVLSVLLAIFMVLFVSFPHCWYVIQIHCWSTLQQKTHKSSGQVKAGGQGYEWTSYASMIAIFSHTVIYSIGPGRYSDTSPHRCTLNVYASWWLSWCSSNPCSFFITGTIPAFLVSEMFTQGNWCETRMWILTEQVGKVDNSTCTSGFLPRDITNFNSLAVLNLRPGRDKEISYTSRHFLRPLLLCFSEIYSFNGTGILTSHDYTLLFVGPRAAATSLALAVNWLSALIVVLTYPFIQVSFIKSWIYRVSETI